MSLTSPYRSSSVWLENPEPEPEDKTDQKQCSRCGDWQHYENYAKHSRGGKRSACYKCEKLYRILIDVLGKKNDDGQWVVVLPDGTEERLVDIATAIVRRGYRLKTATRKAPKPVAPKVAEQIAADIKNRGYPLEKIGTKNDV